MSSSAPELADAARSTAERLTDDQALVARALLDLRAIVTRPPARVAGMPQGASLDLLRGAVENREGSPVSVARIRRALYGLGASSTRLADAADVRVERVSDVRLVDATGGRGGASRRRFRLTPYALEVLRYRDRLDGLETTA
jgi:hypothetical protein